METWGIEQCFLIFLMLLFLCTKRLFEKPCMEPINRSEKPLKEDPNGNRFQRDEPFREEYCDGRKWRHINERWILVWPRPPHRPKDMKQSRYCHHHRHRRRKPVVQKTGLEAIPEGLENELETESKPEPELVGSYRCGTCWWMQVLCLDDVENELEHPATIISKVPRRPRGFKKLFLEPFRCCIGGDPVD